MSSAKVRQCDDAPLLPALLRLVQQSAQQRFAEWLAESRWSDLQPAHSAAVVALLPRPDGARLTELAQQAHITKQSMAALVDHLVRRGYVARVGDPEDGRAARLTLTARGRAYVRDARAFGRSIEADWARRIGARRLAQLRETLALLAADDATS